MKFSKILIIFLFIIHGKNFGQSTYPQEARGVFLSFGVGPRMPIGLFSDHNNIGPGFDAILSYTDLDFLPVFFFTKFGFQNHSGSYNFYKSSEHSTLATSIFSASLGAKYFFPPIIDDMILLMPILEGGVSYAYVENYHQYKIETQKGNLLEKLSKFGFHVGGGLSFFLMDILATYNYVKSNQYFSVDIRITIPIAATL